MLCYKLYVNITVIFSLFRLQDCVHFLTTKQTWVNARQQCIHLGMNLTGSLGFYNNQTANYDPNKLRHAFAEVEGISSFPAWIDGYVKRTLWISQDHCYSIKHKDLNKIDKSFLLPLNGPKECSLMCGTGTFALQSNACFCLTATNKRSLVRKVPITNCVDPCSADSNYYCGSLHASGHHRYLSLYNAIYLKETFPDGYNCLAMSLNTVNVHAKNCEEKLNCFCRNVHGQIVYQSLSSSWERCNRNCRDYGAQVVTIDISYMASLPLQFNVWYWNGYFRFIDQIWNKPLENDFGELEGCMTLEKNGSSFVFGTELCNSPLNAICSTPYKLDTQTTVLTTEVRINNTTTKGNINSLSDEHKSSELLIGIFVGGVLVVLVILITVFCICRRRRGYVFCETNLACSCCRYKKKPRPVAPSVKDLNRNRDGSGRNKPVYEYIDPADIISDPPQNIYEDPDTHFHPKPNIQTDTSGYLEPSLSRGSLDRTLLDEQGFKTEEIHSEARTLLSDIDNTEGDIILNSNTNVGLYHIGRPRYNSNDYHDSQVKETMLLDSSKNDILNKKDRTLSNSNKNNEIHSKEIIISDNG